MRYVQIAMIVIGLFFLTCDAIAHQPNSMVLTMEDSDKEIELAPGETIILQLKDPGTTGAAWYMDELDESHLKSVREEIVHPFSPQKFEGGKIPVGGGGVDIWTFRAVAPGDTVLRLLLYRNWEGKEHTADKFEVTLHITGTSVKDNVLNDPYDEIKKEFSGAKTGRALDIYENGGEDSVGHNAIITVELNIQEGTGADWYIDDLDESRLKFIGKRSVAVSPKIISGGAVVETWYFKAIAPGDATLRLLYYQASEGKENATSKFEYKLHIAGK